MSKVAFVLLLLCVLLAKPVSGLEFDPATPLYLADKSAYATNQVCELVDRLSDKPIVLKVHGRGNEPKKSLSGGTLVSGRAVPTLERDYNVNVIFFNWHSKARGLDRDKPLSRIPQSVDPLWDVLSRLSNCVEQGTIAMLVHSMGNVLLQRTIEKHGWFDDRLFSYLVLSAPDADTPDHTEWLSTLAVHERVFVTMNADDKVLKRAKDGRARGVLPLGLGELHDYAAGAVYLNLSKFGKRPGKKNKTHVMFKKDDMRSHVHVCRVFTALMRGESLPGGSLEVGAQTSRPKFERNASDTCFN